MTAPDHEARAAVLKSLGSTDRSTLARGWANGHVKLAWTARLLQLRTQLADVFTLGDYQALEVLGPHRDQVVAFARRRGKDACIVAVARHFAAFTDGGRNWPLGDAFEGALDVRGFALEGMEAGTEELRLSSLFPDIPAAVLKARWVGAEKTARKRVAA